ncbi:MAG: prepilin-type N-terminal cleavage/methylation domain-containing protein [Candidatus Omnitrophica bacterium]|nr:prepilin-type N-terminal cleavage/methylation domain-containing protein [Candidatus Omnitrophota bacterium]MBI3083770.1 prepilin-type N-terminal cleavage/methylation domain-containing protein [Candidatus Omnitrophota bacterium]
MRRETLRACRLAMPERRRDIGLTLVEILIVATLFAVIAGGIGASFLSGMRLWGRAHRQEATWSNALLTLEAMAKELRQTVPMPSIGFEGTHHTVSFPALQGTRIVKVAYLFNGHKRLWQRQDTDLKDLIEERLAPATHETVVLSADEVTLAFWHFDPDQQAYTWQETWSQEDGIPSAVRVTITIKDATHTKTVWIPIA